MIREILNYLIRGMLKRGRQVAALLVVPSCVSALALTHAPRVV